MHDRQSARSISPSPRRFRLPLPQGPTLTSDARQTSQADVTTPSIDGDYVRGVRRIAYISLAGLFFILALIGIVLPGLPTTPFLLLTSYFLGRSWPRLHQRLLANKIVGPALCHWQQHRAVTSRTKLQAALLVGLAMVWLLGFSNFSPSLLVALFALTCTGLLVIYYLPTCNR